MAGKFGIALSAALLAAAAAPVSAAPVFILNDTGGVGAGTQARAGFEAAAALWAGLFTDNVTIRLDVGFRALGSGILGQTGSSRVDLSYASVRDSLVNGATSFEDTSSAATLPGGSTVSFRSNERGNCTTGSGCRPIASGSRTLDNDNTRDNNFLAVNTTTGKALGLRSDNGTRDASVTFSTAFTWDFDSANGISSSAYDFVGIAAHEIGHALGFVSGVDLVDANIGASGLDSIAWGSVLDLFRYKGTNRDWTVGGTACTSVDAGASCVANMSTGVSKGDGRQASHWKDNLGIGIMDPTASRGEFLQVTEEDLIGFDIMGWDRLAGFGGGGGLVTWSTEAFLDTDGFWEVETDFVDPDPSQAVPVPGAGLLLLGGLAALGLGRMRRRG